MNDVNSQENSALSLANRELLWRPSGQVLPRPDPGWQSWLLDPGSLTQRLKERCADTAGVGQFRVRVLEEGWVKQQSPGLLQCFPSHVVRERMWSRRVLLQYGDVPWVAAHSLIPVSSMQGPLKRLRTLNERPLGEFLFRHPLLRRDQLELTHTGAVWGRRSLFHLYDRPLLVAEFFLPALLEAEVGGSVSDRADGPG
ncbi:MAG: chorismate lyase [Gammaproteobacteria bacterium]|nr:chorismate lyase [Gammaproteobacteria bacterium]